MSAQKSIPRGFTLIELLVAIGISALALVTLTRLFSLSFTGYNLQEQLTGMNQNARYTIKVLSDVLMEAGADLQIVNYGTKDKDTIIIPDGNQPECSGFTIKINPRGGLFQISQTIPSYICTIYVDDARRFRHAGMLARLPGLRSPQPLRFYTLLHVDTIDHFIVFDPATTFQKDDAVCSFVKTRYFINGTDLCINSDSNVIAEDIDSLSILFLDREGDPTAQWKDMRSVQMLVRAKTSKPDHRYKEYPDNCRRITLTYKFRLRNKVELQ